MIGSDATAMAEAIRERQVSPLELVEASIANIEKLNPQLNAVVSKQYRAARCRAREGKFNQAPFAGVPILLKDLGQNQMGEVSSSGSRLLAKYRARRTDHYVTAIENLGFIILGRTNTPEFGFKNISDSSLHGAVSLPTDLNRNAGGSSGGSAAAVASGMVPIAGASDGGGSIRIPASFNGLIGLKTSRGRVIVGPNSYRGWQGASVNFALTRSVRDTRSLLYHMQVCQMESPFPLPTLSRERLFGSKLKQQLKIAVLTESPIGSQVSKSAQEAVWQAADFLSREGHEIVPLTEQPVDGIELMKSYYMMNSVETAVMFDAIQRNLGRKLSLDDMELTTWAIYQSGQKIPATCYSNMLSDWDSYSAKMAKVHDSYDLVLTPTTADVAPKHGQLHLEQSLREQIKELSSLSMAEQQALIWEMFSNGLELTPFTQLANITGQPAISLPTYQNKEGLSLGIQLLAKKGREDLLLQVAQVFEERGALFLPSQKKFL